MKKSVFVALILSLFAVLYALAEESVAPSKITSKDLYEMMKTEDGWYIFDMRTHLNYILAHMPQSRSIPMFMLEKRLKEIPKNAKTVLIFQNDADAEKAWELLMKNGYDSKLLSIFSDTMDEWVADGYPFEDTIPVGC